MLPKDTRSASHPRAASLRSAGEARTLPDMMASLAQVRLWQGDVAGARTLADDALAEARATGYQGNTADGLHRRGTVHLAAGELEAARAALEEAIQVRQRIGETVTIATAEVALAEVLLAAGNPTEGRSGRHAPLATSSSAGRTPKRRMHSPSLPWRDWGSRTRREPRAPCSKRRRWPLPARIATSAARWRSRPGSCMEPWGVKQMRCDCSRPPWPEPRRRVMPSMRAAARLALGRLDLARGRREAGLARLAALEREARARGLLLIAQQAQSG